MPAWPSSGVVEERIQSLDGSNVGFFPSNVGFSNQEMLIFWDGNLVMDISFPKGDESREAHVADNEGQMCLACSLQLMFLKMTPWIHNWACTYRFRVFYSILPPTSASAAVLECWITGFDPKKILLRMIVCPMLLREHFLDSSLGVNLTVEVLCKHFCA